jgi:hypothetical protein
MRARHLRSADRHPTIERAEPATGRDRDRIRSRSGAPESTTVTVHRLRSRACSLRSRAALIEGPLAVSYRRRASELMLQAWLLEVRSGVPLDQIPTAA